jgi:REP element-mobilizing transposase RayT
MPQSLAKLYTHLTFSTKHRNPCLTEDVRAGLHAYMGGTLDGLGCQPIEINSEPEHIHALFVLSRTISLSEAVAQFKTSSNQWLRARGPRWAEFHWQAGYGAFSVSQSGVEELRRYIRDQRQHHKRVSFQDELRAFLRRYGIAYDERYVWE